MLRGQLNLLKELFQALGLVINWEISQFNPTQEITFLGFQISTKTMTVSRRSESRKLHLCIRGHQCLYRNWQRMSTAAKQAIRVAALFHRRHLQALINSVIPFAASKKEAQTCYQDLVSLTLEAKEQLL